MTLDETALLDRQSDGTYVLPTYGEHGVAAVPDTVLDIFDCPADRPIAASAYHPAIDANEAAIDHVVAVVIDGFGWNRFQSLKSAVPSLDSLAEAAHVTPLLSTYPSETAAAMITLYTGLQPVEHGLLGWFVLMPEIDRVALSLPFSTLDGESLDEAYEIDETALLDHGVRPPLPARLQREGVDVVFVQPTEIANSVVTRLVAGDSTRAGYHTLEGGLVRVADRLNAAKERSYHLVYDPAVDAAAHHTGTTSPAYERAVRTACRAIGGFIDTLDQRTAERTLVLVLADHGHVDTDPSTNVALDTLVEEGAIDLERHLRRDGAGEPLYLAGSPRNLQLYTKPGHTYALRDEFAAALDVRTFTRGEYCDAELFGDRPPSPHFERRAPDLVVVHRDRGLWYDGDELDFVGMHGGLHRHEMIVPFICARASALRSAML